MLYNLIWVIEPCRNIKSGLFKNSQWVLSDLRNHLHDISNHPIAQLYRRGVKVTINSDDVLIFDSDVSKEYLRLFQSGCLSAEELDDIRMNGLVKTYK